MSATIEEITAKLEAAATEDSGKSESLTDVEKEIVAAEADDKTETGTKKGTAQDRIQELVSARKEAERKFSELSAKFTEKETELSKLIDLVQDRESDSRIVAKINELHTDPKYKDIVETLDKAIRGIEVEQVKPVIGTEAPKPGEDLLRNLQADVNRTRTDAAAALADQKSDLLLMKSDLVIEKLFQQLPETEYTEDDRKVLNSALADMVDWEAIEGDPSSLEARVTEGVQKAIDWYGNPKGRIAAEAAKATKDTDGDKSNSAPVDLSKLDLGKLKSEVVNGKTKVSPVLSDNDFTAILAEELRRSRGGR